MKQTQAKGVDQRDGMVVEETEFWHILKVEFLRFAYRTKGEMSETRLTLGVCQE